MDFNKDTILFGIILGLVIPFVSYAILLMINDGLAANTEFQFTTKLLALIALCINIFPFRYFSSRRMDYSMRGMIFPTVFYSGLWMYVFGSQLF